jgi:hypothetical protein
MASGHKAAEILQKLVFFICKFLQTADLYAPTANAKELLQMCKYPTANRRFYP